MFKALADPTRRTILDELTDRDGQTLFELCARLLMKHGIDSTRQAISQHLDVLEAAGLVRVKREGRYKFHYLDSAPLKQITDGGPSETERSVRMRIYVTSVLVDDQKKALEFYTNTSGSRRRRTSPSAMPRG